MFANQLSTSHFCDVAEPYRNPLRESIHLCICKFLCEIYADALSESIAALDIQMSFLTNEIN